MIGSLIDKLYDKMIIDYPKNYETLKNQIKSMPEYNAYSKAIKTKIINSMLPSVIDNVRSMIAMCGNIRHVNNSAIKTSIIIYINSLSIFNTIILHILDNIHSNGTWDICGLYDNTIACQIHEYI